MKEIFRKRAMKKAAQGWTLLVYTGKAISLMETTSSV
jgi:hypothetical protein